MTTAVRASPSNLSCEELISQMESLHRLVLQQAESSKSTLLKLPPGRRQSAQNLLNYLALRSKDIRPLQDQLARLGLSSLGRVEAHVLATLRGVLHHLYLMSDRQPSRNSESEFCDAFDSGKDRLELNTIKLFGEHPGNRRAHIMVTMSAAAADDFLLVRQLLQSGMNCMRINCAHDDASVWVQIIEHLRNAQRVSGIPCRVLMDLGGPKLRLGPMESEPSAIKVKPVRDVRGRVLRPARIWMAPASSFSEMPGADANLALEQEWLTEVKKGDRVRFRDARGSDRCWRVKHVSAEGCWAETKKTAYLVNGTVFHLKLEKNGKSLETEIDSLLPQESVCLVRCGDILHISATDEPGKPSIHDSNGKLLNPGRLSMAIPEVYRDVRPGESIFFDDGRIAGIIEKCSEKHMQIRVTHTHKPVEKLQGKRGINLPDTSLSIPALSAKDLQDLEFAARHADLVGLSFANCPDDVRVLYQSLQALGRQDIGVVLKIETKRGFSNLPAILLEALKFHACGIMIARGDLAVECGFERLSEIQEEILWLCEAAHVPVIWATQVLEGLTRRGHASRAEITDAAMAQAAEAVMLNKGAHIVEAVEMLDDILQRMQGHHRKKRSMLRKLQLATDFQVRHQ